MSTLKDKVAIVTGASKGIGAAIAEHLAAAGAAVVVNYASSKEGAERVVGEIRRQGGKAVAVQANGKVVVAGMRPTRDKRERFVLVRYRKNGSLDPSFGSGGEVITNVGSGNATVKGVALRPDGTNVSQALASPASGAGVSALRRSASAAMLRPVISSTSPFEPSAAVFERPVVPFHRLAKPFGNGIGLTVFGQIGNQKTELVAAKPRVQIL